MENTAIRLAAILALAILSGCFPRAGNGPRTEPNGTEISPPSANGPSSPFQPADALGQLSSSRGFSSSSTKATQTNLSTSSSPRPSQSRSLDELLLFYPAKYPKGQWQPKGLVFEDAWFEAEDGTRLHGWFCPCRNPRGVFLFAHGNAGNVSYYGPFLKYLQTRLGVTVLAFDYRGYGRSEGTPTVEGVLQDARAARRFLVRRAGIKETEVVLMGRSLGGAVVVQLAAEANPRWLILESTFSSLKDTASHHYPRLAWLVPASKLDSVAQIARYQGPLLQSHGDADQTIPIALGWKLFQAAKGPKDFVRIPGADHNDPPSREYLKRLEQFVASLPGN